MSMQKAAKRRLRREKARGKTWVARLVETIFCSRRIGFWW